jgi:7-cyano-7-deazaguanine synthase in queuosine biosynthesis
MKKKTVLVPWSGGLDSTYLVWSLLKGGHSVYGMYIDLQNNAEKVKCEKEALEKLEAYIRSKDCFGGNLCRLPDSVVGIGHGGLFDMKQNCIWMLHAAYHCDTHIDEVQIGYVLNDCSVSFIPEMQRFWKALTAFTGLTSKKLPPLKFPLIKHMKSEMEHEMPWDLTKNVWFCEVPHGGKPCGSCQSCTRQKDLLTRQYPPQDETKIG